MILKNLSPSKIFLKMGDDVIFSNSRFTAVFLHQKSMECILLVRWLNFIRGKNKVGLK